MNREYSIREKQELTEKLKDCKFFSKDLSLFQEKFPHSGMNRELARVNDVNRDELCGRMLYALLDVCSEEEITSNRKSVEVEVPEGKQAVVASPSEAVVLQNNKKKDKKQRNSR